MTAASTELIYLFGLGDLVPHEFYSSKSDLERRGNPLTYAHLMRRAWEEMGLNGILCVDQKPAVYFKEVNRIDSASTRTLHKLFWNQGTAPLLVLISPKEVQIFSGLAFPSKEGEDPKDGARLVEILSRATEAVQISDFVKRVQTGHYYLDKQKHFDSTCSVDQYLLRNLRDTCEALVNLKLKRAHVHSLIGKIIFTCYLTDRKIINGKQFRQAGAEGVNNLRELFSKYSSDKAIPLLFQLFNILHQKLNGSMFSELPNGLEKQFSKKHLQILQQFLNGEEISKGQMTFGFWVYDFSVIPIETISAIYEDFLASENEDEQRRKGAYFTPRHLAEMVVDVAVEGWNSLLEKRFLDPACGSGIFLVILFNRIAEELHRTRNNQDFVHALLDTLKTSFCGVDLSETACRITCFSLYLAFLDHLSPPDIDRLEQKHKVVLPDLLITPDAPPAYGSKTGIFHGNFFDTRLDISTKFDLVIGNPPWVGRGHMHDEMAIRWCQELVPPLCKDTVSLKKNSLKDIMPGKQVSHAFMWKAPLHIHNKGRVCLLLPSKVLLNQATDQFQAAWFSQFTVERVVQFSDLRFILFENAICPATAIRFTSVLPQDINIKIDYDVPKFYRNDPREGLITVFPEDCNEIRLRALNWYVQKKEAPLLWKNYLWGTTRDIRFLERMYSLPRLQETITEKKWRVGQGFKPFNQESYSSNPKTYGEAKLAWWDDNHYYIDAKNKGLDLVVLRSDCSQIGNKYNRLYCSPDRELFSPPMVLVNHGFTHIAFCDFNVLFQHTLQSISGAQKDTDLLCFLSGVLNSNLAKYFLFHTAANWGVERDKVHLFELLRLPFPLPDQTSCPHASNKIIKDVAFRIKMVKKEIKTSSLRREDRICAVKNELERLIYDYYEISDQEQMLIDDTVAIFEPSSTPHSVNAFVPTLRPVNAEERSTYVDTLCAVLNDWAKHGSFRLTGSGQIIDALGIGIVTLKKTKKNAAYKETVATEAVRTGLARIMSILNREKKPFTIVRNLKVFDGDELHIIKQLALRHWTRTCALNDADEIASAILASGRGR